MRVIVVHNQYHSSSPSGENLSVRDEVGALRDAGHVVFEYFRSSDEIDTFATAQKLLLPLRPLYSSEDARAFRELLTDWRPDVVHAHNLYPLISPTIIRIAHAAGVPVVQAVRNYRHACVAGTFFRNGAACTDCRGHIFPWPAVVHGCYRSSRAQSAVMSAAIAVHRSTMTLVSRFLPISHHVADQLRADGIPAERITVKYNFLPDPGDYTAPPARRQFLFLGRLVPSKGLRELLRAWEVVAPEDAELVVAGSGPEDHLLASPPAGVRYVGHVGDIRSLLNESSVVVVPSLWEEPFGRAVIEAFAHGRPVLASDTGALSELVDCDVGWLVPATVKGLAGGLRSALSDDLAARAAAARQRYEALFTPQTSIAVLENVYRAVVGASAGVAGD